MVIINRNAASVGYKYTQQRRGLKTLKSRKPGRKVGAEINRGKKTYRIRKRSSEAGVVVAVVKHSFVSLSFSPLFLFLSPLFFFLSPLLTWGVRVGYAYLVERENYCLLVEWSSGRVVEFIYRERKKVGNWIGMGLL